MRRRDHEHRVEGVNRRFDRYHPGPHIELAGKRFEGTTPSGEKIEGEFVSGTIEVQGFRVRGKR